MSTPFNPASESVTRFIEEEEFIYNIDTIFHQVFCKDIYSTKKDRYQPLRDYYADPVFTKRITHRALLQYCGHFPSDEFSDEPFLMPIVQVAARLGDRGCYMTGLNVCFWAP